MIQATTSLKKIASLRKKIRAVRGGQGSGKTISILILLINHASSKPNKEILILSAELTKMRLTVIKDFVKVMRMAGIFDEQRFIAGTLYRFPNGSFIKFIGLDKEDVGKGLRSDVSYFNEVNKISAESYRQVASRTGQIYLDYNPDAEFFVDTDIIPREDCAFIQLTFEDNELLPQSEREEILNYFNLGYNLDGTIKNAYWANLWQVYGLGNIGSLQGVVFSNWKTIDQLPTDAKLMAYGMDFGFTNDPTTLTAIYQHDGKFIFDELIYQKGLLNNDIANKMISLGVSKSLPIYGDSAEPKTIKDLSLYGFRMKPAVKGADSISFGVQKMQENEFFVTAKSGNLINELRAYTWDVDRNGVSTNKPIDSNNHAIDGIRYYFTSTQKNSGKYMITRGR